MRSDNVDSQWRWGDDRLRRQTMMTASSSFKWGEQPGWWCAHHLAGRYVLHPFKQQLVLTTGHWTTTKTTVTTVTMTMTATTTRTKMTVTTATTTLAWMTTTWTTTWTMTTPLSSCSYSHIKRASEHPVFWMGVSSSTSALA